jgi:hypothetical protein
MYMWVVLGQPAYARGKKKHFPHAYATMSNTTHVHPQRYGKHKNAIIKSPLNLLFCRMYVHWRKREHEVIDLLVDEDLELWPH